MGPCPLFIRKARAAGQTAPEITRDRPRCGRLAMRLAGVLEARAFSEIEITRDHPRPSETIRDHPRSPETTPRPPRGHPEITRGCRTRRESAASSRCMSGRGLCEAGDGQDMSTTHPRHVQQVWPGLPSGVVASRAGTIMAAAGAGLPRLMWRDVALQPCAVQQRYAAASHRIYALDVE